MTCSTCGGEIKLGDYPLCHGDPSKHERMGGGFLGDAKRFDPVVVFRNPRTGEISVPGRNDEAAPRGYQRVEADNIRAVRRLEKEIQQRSVAESQALSASSGGYHPGMPEAVVKQKREIFREKMQTFSPEGRRFHEHAMKRADEKRAKKMEPKPSTGGGFEAFNQNRSNRLEHNDPATGQKARG